MIKRKSLGLLVLGFIIGGISIGGLIAWRYSIMFRDQYYGQISEITNTAYMIRAGKSDQLVNNCESSIAQCVAAANSLWKDNDRRLSSFWYAQRYYQQFELDIPKELEPIFSTLPPRPLTSCESKRVTDSNQIRDTEQGAASHAASQRP